ncbi:HAMP domain-containing histidine kinase [Nocardioides caeni]|uniref:histidine kinase n=1 Tax=Nocardioides caeni TaxID=574700 RepID=A0A4S8N3G6_9ACTN|nr:HAMP domain-containing sensor histidine kinase [Nocardioides caeni]THV10528.1 HAMP domain-containing histidine kinase [Nocardioides caeni]
MRATRRERGPSVRLRLALSYAGFVLVAGAGLLAVVWVFLLRYVPADAVTVSDTAVPEGPGFPDRPLFIPGRSDLWEAFAPKAALMLGFLLVVGLVGGWLLAGRMLAPLDRITRATRLASAGSLSHRVDLPGRGAEFRELADAFDTMLARLEAHVAEQQRFAANASHELRTPLAITQTLLEVAQREPDRDVDELMDRLQSVNGRAIALVEALLLLSRAEARIDDQPVDLSLAAEEAVETLLPLAERRGITIESTTDAAVTPGSPALVAQLVTNLVHNAIVHNLPAGGRLRISTGISTGIPTGISTGISTGVAFDYAAAVLTVENTGECLDPALVATLVEPFQRGNERAQTEHAGVGLGLAIVDRIVLAHGGTLSVVAREGGGLTTTVRLPLSEGG